MAEVNRWGVVYSPHLSLTSSHKRWKQMRKYLDQKGVQYDFVQSESMNSVPRLVTMLCENEYHTIVIVGGDGALNDAVNVIMGYRRNLPDDFAFAVIPNGIGNDFSRFWGITVDDYRTVIDSIILRRVRKIDVGRCEYNDNGTVKVCYFLNCINIGLGARLVKTTNDALSIIGSRRLSLIPVLISKIFQRKQFCLSLHIDTELVEGKYMSVCIGNCHGYGQTPNAVPYNGMLDVSVISRPEWWQLFEGFWLLGKGRFLNYKNVHPFRALQMSVTDVSKAYVSLDGRVLLTRHPEPLHISVEEETLPFIIPIIPE